MRIGVVSDTHIPTRARTLPPQLYAGLAGVDLIIHAGDITTPRVLEELSAIAPVEAVFGNMDPYDLRQRLTHSRVLTVEGWRIGLIHGDGASGSTIERVRKAFEDVHCIVFGHSHRALCEEQYGVLMFNPGSPTDRRTSRKFSYGILSATLDGIQGEIHYF